MAVSVVASNSRAQPNHVLDSKVVGEDFFVIGARHGRISLLDLAEQTLLRGEQSALPVHIDGAAFEDDPVLAEDRAEFAGVGGFCYDAAYFFVLLVLCFFGPRVSWPTERAMCPPYC